MSRDAPIPDTITVHVPFRVAKRGGRMEMVLPEGAAHLRNPDSTLIKALARAFRWKRMLDSGQFATIGDLAEHEKISHSYMTRVLRLTLLAPDIVEAILDERQGPELTMARLLNPFPAEWAQQSKWNRRIASANQAGDVPTANRDSLQSAPIAAVHVHGR